MIVRIYHFRPNELVSKALESWHFFGGPMIGPPVGVRMYSRILLSLQNDTRTDQVYEGPARGPEEVSLTSITDDTRSMKSDSFHLAPASGMTTIGRPRS